MMKQSALIKALIGATIGASALMLSSLAMSADDTPASAPAAAPATTPAPAPAAAPQMAVSGVITTDSGLQYRDLAIGNGTTAGIAMTVFVQYTGWLQNADGSRGKQFDSSRGRGEPLDFVLGSGKVIKGWEEGINGMKVGGKRRLVIPPAIAYGSKNVGNGLIPPNSTLIFEVELVKVQQ